jgi:hypothetical protein
LRAATLTGFDVVRDSDQDVAGGWLLSISGKDDRSWIFQTARGVTRSFRKIETAIDVIEKITAGRVSHLSYNL